MPVYLPPAPRAVLFPIPSCQVYKLLGWLLRSFELLLISESSLHKDNITIVLSGHTYAYKSTG